MATVFEIFQKGMSHNYDSVVTSYDFPSIDTAESPDPYLITHHPQEVWGYEDEKLIMGIVSPTPQ